MVYKELFIHRGQIIKPDEEKEKENRKRTERRISFCYYIYHALFIAYTCQI